MGIGVARARDGRPGDASRPLGGAHGLEMEPSGRRGDAAGKVTRVDARGSLYDLRCLSSGLLHSRPFR